MLRQLLAASFLICLLPGLALAQPPGPVRMIAEWEPIEAVMIRYPLGISLSLVEELAEDTRVYVIIATHQIATATAQFSAQGVDMANIDWFVADSYSHWSRDWGPQNLFDGNGEWGILDPWFNGYPWVPREATGYEQDDNTPAEFAAYLGENLWQPPFYLTGGNIMFDGHGRAFCSEAQVDESDHLSEAEFRAALQLWCGVEELVVLPNTEGVGIQHIDCVAKFLDEETVMVKELYPGHADAPHVEENAQILAGMTSCYGNPLTIHRVHCGPFGGTGMTAYTNSLILGKKVLVPVFNCAGDEPALQAYRDAMPGYEVIAFTGSWYYYDALHCRTMGIFDRGMLRVDVAPPPAEIPAAAWLVEALIDDRSETGVDLGACALMWRLVGETDFTPLALAPAGVPDAYEAFLPAQAPGAEIEFYVQAGDNSGRLETRPIAAPTALFRTVVAEDLTALESLPRPGALRAWPSPFAGTLQLRASGRNAGEAAVAIFDVRGRSIRSLKLTGGSGAWDGRDEHGRPAPAGVYLVKRIDAPDPQTIKVVRLDSQ